MNTLRFAVLGAGFWAEYQIAAWQEVAGAECVAIYNRTRAKADALATRFGIPAVYDDLSALLDTEQLDFVDIITHNDLHAEHTCMAADRGLNVICQKPLAPALAEAERMAAYCREKGVTLLVHENWRWQAPIRGLKRALETGRIGKPARATVRLISGVDDYVNQPFLKELDELLLADMGIHILDTTRFLFGEAESLWCHNIRVQPDIRGEDLSTVMLRMKNGMTVVCQLALARIPTEPDYYLETLILVEGQLGTIELLNDYRIRTTTAEGTTYESAAPVAYSWLDPAYVASMASIVDCHANLLAGLNGTGQPETTADDNLKTLRLTDACYRSARTGNVVVIGH